MGFGIAILFHEINAFGEHLVCNGAVLAKFWLAITQAEQLRRFNERKSIAFKNFKITDGKLFARTGTLKILCKSPERSL